jgi:fructose-bisphosphate aldolase class II
MAIVSALSLLRDAAAAGTGVAAFNVIALEHAEALVRAADALGAPIILQISENAVRYHGGLEPLALATLALGRAASAPVVVHLDHAKRPELVRQAIELGLGSVMYDASALPYWENVARTAEVVEACHAAGVAVEAELGEVGGKNGVHDPRARTDPGQAARFVAATTVDSLAVAVGTSHAMTSRVAVVDLELIAVLRAAVPVPLVLHGSSGIPDSDLAEVVRAGITKVNIGTRLNVVLTQRIREMLAADPKLVDPRRYLAPARDAVTEEATGILHHLAGAAGLP